MVAARGSTGDARASLAGVRPPVRLDPDDPAVSGFPSGSGQSGGLSELALQDPVKLHRCCCDDLEQPQLSRLRHAAALLPALDCLGRNTEVGREHPLRHPEPLPLRPARRVVTIAPLFGYEQNRATKNLAA